MLALLMVALFGVNEKAWAAWPTYSGSCTTSGYVVYDASLELNTIDAEEINLAGPGYEITFEAKHTLTGAGELKVAQYVDGNWSDAMWSDNPGEKKQGVEWKKNNWGIPYLSYYDYWDYKSYTVSTKLNPRATKIKFYTEVGATLYKTVQNIRVTRYSDNAYTLYTGPLDCGSADYNSSNSSSNYTTATAYVDWSHKSTAPNCTITGTNDEYFYVKSTSNPPSNNHYGAMSVEVAYKHTAPGDHTAILNVGGKTITVKGHTNKITPYIVTTPTVDPITYGQTISNSQLGTGLVKADLINAAGTVVPGTWTIDEKGQTVTTSGGSNTTVHLTFTPTDGNTYNTIHTTQSMFVRSVATISWESAYSAEKPTVPVGKWIENAATTNAAGAVITYSSTSSNVEISADGHSFRFTAEDEAEVVASHGVTATHGSASETKTFKSTFKAIQVIVWADRFDRLTTEMTTKPLIAEVWIENPTTGERTYSSARTALLEYSSNNSNVVSVSATTLTIEGKGTTTLRAYVQGNDQYEEASLTMPVKVREPSEGCEDPILLNKPNDGTNDYLYRLFSMSTSKPELYSDEYEINIAQGQVPGKLSFGHKGEEYKPVSFFGAWAYYSGSIKAQQKVNGQWIDVPNSSVTPEKSKWNTIEDLQLDENATHIRFVRPQGGEGYHYVRNVEVTMKHFIRTETPEVDFGNTIKVNSSEFKDVTIHYSNVKDALSVTNPFESDVTTDDIVEVASCGAFGDAKLRITYSPTTAGPINDVIVVKDPILKTTCDIRVKADVQRADQKITWKPDTELLATETIELNGTTNGQEHGVMNAITYTVTNNEDVISVTNNVVTVLKPGTVTITATQNGSTNYGIADPVEKNFTISAETLTLVAPTAQGITYGQALSESELSGGSAKDSKGNDVGGTFAWQSPDAELNAGDNQTPTVVFTPSTNAAWYTNLTTTANINVAKASQTITWEPATNISTIDQILLNGTTNGQENDVMNTITYTVTNNNDVISVTNNVVTILKPGTVTITASQNGSANYAAATPVVKNFTISAEPLTLTAPTAQNITYGQALSESELTGGSAKDSKNNTVYGTFAWQTGSTQPNASDDAQAFTVVFTPSTNAAWYTDLTTTATVNVNKATSAATPTAAAITYGAKVVTSELSNEGTAGSWAWKEADRNRILSAGDHTLYVNFTPSSSNYSTLEDVAVLLTVNRATATLSWTSAPTELAYNGTATYTATSVSNGAITYSIIAGEEYAHIANGVLTVDQPGHTVTIQASQVDGTNHTTPLAITQVVTIAAAPVNEFTNNNGTGDGDWSNPANWSNGLPSGDADVIISKDVTISSNITVGDLTIEKGATVLIVTGGTLTVTGETEYREAGYGDIHVKDDGNLVFENTADFKVNDFILDAKLGDGTKAREGASGQVENPGKMEIKGDAYFELALDPSGECSQGWYEFTVPFPVDALTGISRYHGDNLISITYNRNYALMVYDEAARAAGGKGWNYFTGTLQPGICYTITIDDVDNVYRFKKTNDGAFNTAMTQSLHYTDGAGNTNQRGWNGIGNGTLQHINLGAVKDVAYVQIYDHNHNRYIPSALSEFTYVVGSAFFVQSPAAKPDMTYVAASTEESNILRAPKRYEETKDLCLTLTKDGDEYIADRMYVGASEDALNSYEIGHDLAKIGNPTEAKVAQIWANEYGLKLCDVEMPLVSNSANCEINLFAPAAGNYELNVEEAPENTMLYLTYNGRAIWNLTYSPYVFDLTKGTTEGYGLKMYVMQVATDIEQSGFSNQNSVRKVLIDDVIYIVTPEGKMYDIVGKSANY